MSELVEPTSAELEGASESARYVPAHMLSVLADAGVALADVSVPLATYHTKIDWEDLCYFSTRDSQTKASPILLVTEIEWQPEAEQQFEAYRGLVLVKFATEFGDEQFVTHAMAYEETGQYLPLSAWLKHVVPPCLCRFGRIETRKAKQYVIRPLPVGMDVS